ncbi:toll/interleukin-1 receptor domain-containing protein [Flavisolibacter sp. BT320]|nr:toll/interleukin-1 receptor domain-containing protein [Flavisolibacter longurius]
MHSENFDGAISFAGEHRSLARSITRQLAPLGYKIFYDKYYSLWGELLSEAFFDIYRNVKIIVIIVSTEYNEKMWTRHERRIAVSNFINQGGKLLQIKVDGSSLPDIGDMLGYETYTGNNLHQLCSGIISAIGKKKQLELPVQDELITEIMQACYRRAIYTAMNSEVSTEAMFDSIRACIGELNRLIPKIYDGVLSQYVKSIVKDLDSIDRYSKGAPHYSCLFTLTEKEQIDSIKIEILDKLHFLNYQYNARMDLPDDIGLDYELRGYAFPD